MTTNPNVFTINSTSNIRNKNESQTKAKQKLMMVLSQNGETIFNEHGWSLQPKKEIDSDFDSEPKCFHSLYGLLCLLILTSAATSATLLSVHNPIIHPEYWYEIIFSSTSTFISVACCSTIAI